MLETGLLRPHPKPRPLPPPAAFQELLCCVTSGDHWTSLSTGAEREARRMSFRKVCSSRN